MSQNSQSSKFYKNAYEFIPICCHYDDKTLLTKDGELIQTIQINGINQENISMNLLSLREIIRNSLRKNVNTTELACWIHTIRRKSNLDDETPYPGIFSQNIHDIWVRKNYWDDKFVNTLFISFVFKGSNFKISNLKNFLESFKNKYIEEEHENYLKLAREKLETVVSGVAKELNEFGAERLGIQVKGDEVYCQMLSLFYGLLRFIEIPKKIEEIDLSKVIGSFDYAVGSNKVEVIADDKRKYAAILALKEYQEVSAKTLDRLLQQPTEFVITEVFHFVPPKEAKNKISYQNYIINVSGDQELARQKGITTMLEAENKYQIPFCYQRISILIMNEDMEKLETSVANASFQLARIGLVHIREDINIENAFWSQIPSNFKYLRRLNPTSVDSVASMASLHNFPAGNHTNVWGQAVTILRSEKGTPYFFNFHDSSGSAKCMIVGNKQSGKTVLGNFLTSEALKYDPAFLLVNFDNDSQVFIKANNGKIASKPFNIDPFKLKIIKENPFIITEFINAMVTTSDSEVLSEGENEILDKLIEFILSIPESERSFSKINDFNFEGENGLSIKSKLTPYLPGGEYHNYFIDDNRWDTEINKIQGINFNIFSDENFAKTHYPPEEKMLPQYFNKLLAFSICRELIFYCNIFKYIETFENNKQIIKIENSNYFFSTILSLEFYKFFFDKVSSNNNIYTNSINYSPDEKFFDSNLWQEMQHIFTTKIYLSAEAISLSWKEKLHLKENEFTKLKSLIPATRLFLVKQEELTICCELSLGGLVGVIKMMSSDQEAITKCEEIIQIKGEDPEKWLIEYYDSLR